RTSRRRPLWGTHPLKIGPFVATFLCNVRRPPLHARTVVRTELVRGDGSAGRQRGDFHFMPHRPAAGGGLRFPGAAARGPEARVRVAIDHLSISACRLAASDSQFARVVLFWPAGRERPRPFPFYPAV